MAGFKPGPSLAAIKKRGGPRIVERQFPRRARPGFLATGPSPEELKARGGRRRALLNRMKG